MQIRQKWRSWYSKEPKLGNTVRIRHRSFRNTQQRGEKGRKEKRRKERRDRGRKEEVSSHFRVPTTSEKLSE